MTPQPQAPDDDLAWLAFRYVAGDLDPDDSAAFELRLDRDQPAREAVAGAVALRAGVVRAAPTFRSTPGSRSRVRRAAVVALASAACLALALAPRLVGFRPHGDSPDARIPAPGSGAGSAVALTWSGLRQEAAETPRQDDSTAALDDLEVDTVIPIETTADAGDRVEGLPSWLIEAASLRPSS
jgi:ferric-dicitrate binding protein FerR (iron transport regulator)